MRELVSMNPRYSVTAVRFSYPGYISARFAIGKTVLYTSVGINLPDVAGSNRGK